ncbi:MAG: hypothetical protein JNL21_24775 [Myxococcales bacterium]|nr:hypothetical protein [Myxococcales bacterium]
MTIETLESLVLALAGSVGEEQAREIVRREAARLGLSANLNPGERLKLLHEIESLSGPIGLAARLLVVRLARSRDLPGASGAASSTQLEAARPAPASAAGARVPVAELVQLFSKSLGEIVAFDLVRSTMARLGIVGDSLSPIEAETILDAIDASGGVAGAVARFAKVRFLLKLKRGPTGSRP